MTKWVQLISIGHYCIIELASVHVYGIFFLSNRIQPEQDLRTTQARRLLNEVFDMRERVIEDKD